MKTLVIASCILLGTTVNAQIVVDATTANAAVDIIRLAVDEHTEALRGDIWAASMCVALVANSTLPGGTDTITVPAARAPYWAWLLTQSRIHRAQAAWERGKRAGLYDETTLPFNDDFITFYWARLE